MYNMLNVKIDRKCSELREGSCKCEDCPMFLDVAQCNYWGLVYAEHERSYKKIQKV